MINSKTLVALAAVIAMIQPALAATSLCIEENSIGFSWKSEAWTPMTYNLDQYLVRQISNDEEISAGCYNQMGIKGVSEQIIEGEFSTTSYACYALYELGTEPHFMDVSLCTQYYKDGKVSTVNCNGDGFAEYKFYPSGEIVLTRTYAAPALVEPGLQRDSLFMSIGKCSVIAP